MNSIVITSKASISSLGHQPEQIWQRYLSDTCYLNICCFNNEDTPIGRLQPETLKLIDQIRKENSNYRRLDKTVLMAILASRICIENSDWENMEEVGINIGSSRGATQLFEKYHSHFLNSPNQKISPLTSPTTTLGNIASWVSNDLSSDSINLSHSITCSTALHSILNACAWINSGMSQQFLAGASESPLTDFTVSQMKSLGIYTKKTTDWCSTPLQKNAQNNSMCLGEGASVFAMEKDNGQKRLAKIIGVGYATEKVNHPTSISDNGESMQKSMKMAIKDLEPKSIDAIVVHAPGTIKGDNSELMAIKEMFKDKTPHLISTKFQTGHTLGASGGLSLDLAIEMIHRNELISFPYDSNNGTKPSQVNTVLINAIGFGGNAVSLVITK
ncbi:MAG: beta-ketoacyl synthase N-terminal-like domain-containing protein [Flavobacteriales bacterium]